MCDLSNIRNDCYFGAEKSTMHDSCFLNQFPIENNHLMWRIELEGHLEITDSLFKSHIIPSFIAICHRVLEQDKIDKLSLLRSRWTDV